MCVCFLRHTAVGNCFLSMMYDTSSADRLIHSKGSVPDWLLLISPLFLFLPKWYSGIPLVPIMKICLSFQSATGFTDLHLQLPPSCSPFCTSNAKHNCKHELFWDIILGVQLASDYLLAMVSRVSILAPKLMRIELTFGHARNDKGPKRKSVNSYLKILQKPEL